MYLTPSGKGSHKLKVKFVGGKDTEVTVDSGAEESVCHEGWGSQFGLEAVGKRLKLKGGRVAT